MTRAFLDQGLPYTAASFLRAAGWDVVHAIDLGMSRASDIEIIQNARQDQRVICTFDADFHALLATSGYNSPSVVRIRREGLKARELADLLLAAWPRVASALEQGAMVTITEQTIRIRQLPIA